jgi:hypothetical protein
MRPPGFRLTPVFELPSSELLHSQEALGQFPVAAERSDRLVQVKVEIFYCPV